MDNRSDDRELAQIGVEAEAIERAVQQAVRQAMREKRRAGHPAVGWQQGRVVWVSPEQLPVEDDSDPASGAEG